MNVEYHDRSEQDDPIWGGITLDEALQMADAAMRALRIMAEDSSDKELSDDAYMLCGQWLNIFNFLHGARRQHGDNLPSDVIETLSQLMLYYGDIYQQILSAAESRERRTGKTASVVTHPAQNSHFKKLL